MSYGPLSWSGQYLTQSHKYRTETDLQRLGGGGVQAPMELIPILKCVAAEVVRRVTTEVSCFSDLER